MAVMQDVFERVWSDEALRNNLFNNPKQVLAEIGVKLPDSVTVQVHENTSSLVNYILPDPSEIPEGTDLEKADPVAGKVIKQALSDETFKASLLLNPKQAIATSTGVKLPDDLDVQVYEDTSTVKHLVLPTNPADDELNDLELEAIAGGGKKANDAKAGCGGATVGAVIGAAAATVIPLVGLGIAAGVGGLGAAAAQGASAAAEASLD